MQRCVLLLTTDLLIGGTPSVVRELAVRLNALPGIHVEVACLASWGPVADQIAAAGVNVTAMDACGNRDLTIIPRLIALIRDRKFDTVFSFLMHANAVAALSRLCLRRVRFFQSIQTAQRPPWWHWQVQRLAQWSAEKIIVPSASVARVAREWSNVPAQKIVIIPNAIDPADFTPSQIPQQDPRPWPIGFIGRLDWIKNVRQLLAAMRAIKQEAHLHIFGEGEDRPFLEKRIGQLELQSCVTMHGEIRGAAGALQSLGCLVLPSRAEGFGLVLIEAMAAGVPIVATDAPGIRDVVRNEETGLLVPVDDEESLVEAMRRIMHDRDLRLRLIANGATEVRSRYTWDAVLPRYRDILGL